MLTKNDWFSLNEHLDTDRYSVNIYGDIYDHYLNKIRPCCNICTFFRIHKNGTRKYVSWRKVWAALSTNLTISDIPEDIVFYEEIIKMIKFHQIPITDKKLLSTIELFNFDMDIDYWITKSGEVYSKDTLCKLSCKESNGYMSVGLQLKSMCKHFLMHRLVALSFIPVPNDLKQYNLALFGSKHNKTRVLVVNHLDGNRSNNDVSNLEWCTHKENIHHSGKIKRRHMYLDDDFIINILKMLIDEKSYKEISEKMNISVDVVYRICIGRIRPDIYVDYKDKLPPKYATPEGRMKSKDVYPDEVFHEIAKDLISGMYNRDIVKKYNVSCKSVTNFLYGRRRKRIHKIYENEFKQVIINRKERIRY